jgi:N-acetylglucosaminyldiphosphoundecaprenol N-acetyl-beta-D-mannosaminyltransferase
MQRHGLEWLCRLATEPGRLGRRYATVVPLFLILLAGDLLRTAFSRPGPTQ